MGKEYRLSKGGLQSKKYQSLLPPLPCRASRNMHSVSCTKPLTFLQWQTGAWVSAVMGWWYFPWDFLGLSVFCCVLNYYQLGDESKTGCAGWCIWPMVMNKPELPLTVQLKWNIHDLCKPESSTAGITKMILALPVFHCIVCSYKRTLRP